MVQLSSIHRLTIVQPSSPHLQIIPGISSRSHHISPHIFPKRENHINNDRWAHRQNGGVHKILTDFTGGNTHTGTDGGTYAECVPFNKTPEAIHIANLRKSVNSIWWRLGPGKICLHDFSYWKGGVYDAHWLVFKYLCPTIKSCLLPL